MTAVIVSSLVVLVGACGSEGTAPPPGDEEAISNAMRSMQRSFETGQWRPLCGRLDATARRQAGSVAHGTQDGCLEDVGEAFEVIDSGDGMHATRGSRLVSTAVSGNDAIATMALPGHGRVDVPLAWDGSDWRLSSFFGTPLHAARTATVTQPRAFPKARRTVAITDGSGAPCLPLFHDGYAQVAGGCELRALASRLRLTIGTVFGHFKFGHCELEYRVLADRGGRTWTDSVALRGPGNVNNGCSDVSSCEDARGQPLPWRGRISASRAGVLVHSMRVCFDTCIGVYVGSVTVALSSRGGWHAIARNAGVGRSGLRLDGRVELDAPGGFYTGPAPARHPP